MCLSWGNGANLVERELLGQSEGGGIGDFLVSLKDERNQYDRSNARIRSNIHF